ncbi:LexA/Signal peptidase [Cubamyces sp. BRFM 1775]|nr:LexA/Signal peptidase [Cubamyces sp. BRFM 1775]
MLFGRFSRQAIGTWRAVLGLRPRHVVYFCKNHWRSIGYWGLQTVNFACFLHLFGEYVAMLSAVEGPSMMPTMSVNGELTLELKRIDPATLKRGDLVTYISPVDPARTVCKRVTGLPGDIVCVDPTGQYAPSTEHVVIPRNHLWVTGDNLPYSRDSRMYGPIPFGLVKGRLYARVLPWKERGVFRNTLEYID